MVESTVLPVPPFGENTVTTRPRASPSFEAWPDRPPVSCALRIANEIVSANCGITSTSSTPAVNAVSTRPECGPGTSRTIGASVWRRITATSVSRPVATGSPSRPAPSRTAWTSPSRRCGTASRTSAAQATTSRPLSGAASASRRSDSPSNVPVTTTRRVSCRLPVGEHGHLLPPASTVANVSAERWLSFGFLTGRSCSVQSPLFIT